MSESLGVIPWVATLINASLSLFAGLFVLTRYQWNRLRQSLFWGSALIFWGLAYFTEFGYMTNIIPANVVSFSLQNSFLSVAMILLYCGCALFFTQRRFYTTLLPMLLLAVLEINIAYFYLVAGYQSPVVLVNIILFGVPIVIFSGSSFMLDYLSSKRRGSLLVSISTWMYSGLGPLFYFVNLTPYEAVFHFLSALTIAIMFLGFIMLVGSRSESRTR